MPKDSNEAYNLGTMRIILYTGKGGVGKTSVAAASALRCAELGYRTIILSTDIAHSLSDSFEVSLSSEPQPIVPNLWGQETNMLQTIKTKWGTIQKWIAALFAWRGLEEIVAEEMAILPGMEELANLLYITDYYESGNYEVIIVDCAPTGETLRLLSFPEVMRWWMDRLFPIERTVTTLLRPLVRPVLHIPLPDDAVFDEVQSLFRQLQNTHALLTSADKSSVRLVVNPERMVIKEAQRTYTYLNLYGYPTDLIVCNRMIPPEVEDSYFQAWKESQGRNYQLIEEGFSPLPIFTVPFLDREVVGISMLRVMAEFLYKGEDPAKLFFKGLTQSIQKENGSYVINLLLPFTSKEQLSLLRTGDELIIQVGSLRRNLILPHILAGLAVKEARFDKDRLRIEFEEKVPAEDHKPSSEKGVKK